MKQPRTYIAPHDVYTGGELYRPGQPFTTDGPRGAAWRPIAGERATRARQAASA